LHFKHFLKNLDILCNAHDVTAIVNETKSGPKLIPTVMKSKRVQKW